MKIISNKNKLVKIIQNEKNLGFVPTMGSLHLGHISLIKRSIIECNKTLVSIYINKPQFNRKSDYKKYPRDLNKDIYMLKRLKVDYLFIPNTLQMYPNGPSKNIKIHPLGKVLCGKNRPGHFEAIVDVVNRFIKIIKPKKIYFGKKDMQQLKIVENFIKNKYPEIKVVPCNTIREKNGVAFSSRNHLLSIREKEMASKIYKYLNNNKYIIISKKIKFSIIKKEILKLGANKIDYLKVLDINKLTKPLKNKKKLKIFIAYYLRSTRLIDNI